MTWANQWPLSTPIGYLVLSVRSHNCLVNHGYKTVQDVVTASEATILGLPNAGRKTITELKEALERGPPGAVFNNEETIRDLQCQVSYWKGRYEGLLAGIEKLNKP